MPVYRNEEGKYEAFVEEEDADPIGVFDTEHEAMLFLDDLEEQA